MYGRGSLLTLGKIMKTNLSRRIFGLSIIGVIRSVSLGLFFIFLAGCTQSSRDDHKWFYSLSFLDVDSVRFKINGQPLESKDDSISKLVNLNKIFPLNTGPIDLSVRIEPRDNEAGNYTFGLARIWDDGKTETLIDKTIKLPITKAYVESWTINGK
jgi:hypothetical protein